MRRMLPGHKPAWLAGMAGLALLGLAGPVRAVPIQIGETNFALELPAGFEEGRPEDALDGEVIRWFVQRVPGADEPETWLAIRRAPESGQGWGGPTGLVAGADVLGSYTEPWQHLDVDVLRLRSGSNWLAHSARLPLATATVEVRLASRTLSEEEMSNLMRRVLASVETRSAPDGGMPGWLSAALYLVLGGLVVVAAFVRR